jgi:hypothetical protein
LSFVDLELLGVLATKDWQREHTEQRCHHHCGDDDTNNAACTEAATPRPR